MSNLELGVFAFMLIFSFGFMALAFKMGYPYSVLFRLIAFGMFMGISILLVSGWGVVQTHTSAQTIKNTATGETWNENDTNADVILPSTTTSSGSNAAFFGYIFLGLALINIFLLIKEVWEA